MSQRDYEAIDVAPSAAEGSMKFSCLLFAVFNFWVGVGGFMAYGFQG